MFVGMIEMDKTKIKTLIKQVRGVSYKPDDLHNELNGDSVILLRANNIDDGKINFDDVVYVDKSKVSDEQYLRKGDILICASSGSKNLVGKAASVDFDRECTFGAFCKAVRPNEDVVDYLGVYFQSPVYRRKISEVAIGANINNIRNEHIDELEVPLFSRDEQQEIVKKIQLVLDIISKRKDEISSLDDLIRARFVEMFGTPYVNEKGFPMLTVDDVIEFTGGAQPDKKYFEYEPTEDNIRLIQIRDYKTDNYITYIPKSMAKRFCEADDIMIGRYGPPIFQILKGIEGSYNVALMKATPKIGNKEFIRYFLKQECLFNYLDGLSQRTAGQSGIEMPALKAYPFPYPPIELQEQFEQFANQVDKSKFDTMTFAPIYAIINLYLHAHFYQGRR